MQNCYEEFSILKEINFRAKNLRLAFRLFQLEVYFSLL
jgi:hypothetical protein